MFVRTYICLAKFSAYVGAFTQVVFVKCTCSFVSSSASVKDSQCEYGQLAIHPHVPAQD